MFDWLRTLYRYNDTTYEEYYLVDIQRLTDAVSSFALYVTIALIVILAAVFFVLKFKKPEMISGFRKLAIGIAVGYSVATIFLLGYLNVVYYIIDGKIGTNFYLVIGLLGFLFATIVVGIFIKIFKPKAFKIYVFICTLLAMIYGIVLISVIPAKKPSYEPLSTAGMYIFSLALIAIIAFLTFFFDRKTDAEQNTKTLSYAGVCIALSFALSYVKFFTIGATGGSVTFASLLPLMIFAYKFGAKKGVFAGIVYGLLQFIQSPQFYQPMQFLLDYPVAFGAIGVAGIARNFGALKSKPVASFVVGAVIAVTLRYIAHTISGYYVFSSWAWEGWAPLAYSMVYNLYCFADLGVLLVPAVFAFSSKSFRKQLLNN